MFFLAVAGMLMYFSPFASGNEKKEKSLPARSISVSPEYTGLVVPQGEGISTDLIVTNRGRNPEDIDLKVTTVPKGWKAWVKTYSYGVTGVHVESDKSKNLTLRIEPESGVGLGTYTFGIRAQTRDGKLISTSQVVVSVSKKEEEKKPGGVEVSSSYPVLKGPTDAKFEFSLEVKNKLDKDSIFNLNVEAPENWDVNFKPAYEEKFFSSLRLQANQSQIIAVEVKPYILASPGEYPIRVNVTCPEAKRDAVLTVVLTGTYKLDVGTASGLLSLTALRGKNANVSFYVKNSGSAALSNVRFLSFKPENWKVEFKPETINAIAPQEFKQVEVSITPAEQALVGDYSVGVTVEAGKVSKTVELRTTVTASTAWGWIGIGIIVLVVAGLVFLFIRLGRR
jgi:uncharacterized membrane protein